MRRTVPLSTASRISIAVIVALIILASFLPPRIGRDGNAQGANGERIEVQDKWNLVTCFADFNMLMTGFNLQNAAEFVKHPDEIPTKINGMDCRIRCEKWEFTMKVNVREARYPDKRIGLAFDADIVMPRNPFEPIRCYLDKESMQSISEEEAIGALDTVIGKMTKGINEWLEKYRDNAYVSRSARISAGLKEIERVFAQCNRLLANLGREAGNLKPNRKYPIRFRDEAGNLNAIFFTHYFGRDHGDKVINIAADDGGLSFSFDRETMAERKQKLGYASYVDGGESDTQGLAKLEEAVGSARKHFEARQASLQKQYDMLLIARREAAKRQEDEEFDATKHRLQSELGER
jgi:hypothetical protein